MFAILQIMNKLPIATIALLPLLSTVGCSRRPCGGWGYRACLEDNNNVPWGLQKLPSLLECNRGRRAIEAGQDTLAYAFYSRVIARGVDTECGEQGVAYLAQRAEWPTYGEWLGDYRDRLISAFYGESSETFWVVLVGYGDTLRSVGREEEACRAYSEGLGSGYSTPELHRKVADCNGGYGGGGMPPVIDRGPADPTYGEVSLEPGFEPDPYSIEVVVGGDTLVDNIANCHGYVLTSAPDARLQYSTGGSEESIPLSIYVSSHVDTVLFVKMPNGEWICDDDTAADCPVITLEEPMEGPYNIWVGTYNPDSDATADLSFSASSLPGTIQRDKERW